MRKGDVNRVRARVARGAAWLDKVMPGWIRKIKLTDLQLADGRRCVLGQLTPAFAKKCPDVRARARSIGNSFSTVIDGLKISEYQAARMGFTTFRPTHRSNYRWALLDQFWKDEIRARRAPKKERMSI